MLRLTSFSSWHNFLLCLFTLALLTFLPQPAAAETELFYNRVYKIFTDSERRIPHPYTTTSRVQKRHLIFEFFCHSTIADGQGEVCSTSVPLLFLLHIFRWKRNSRGKIICSKKSPVRIKSDGWPHRKIQGASNDGAVLLCLGETAFESTRLGRSEAVFFTGDTVFLDGAAFPPGQFITDVLNLDSEALTG